MSRGRTVSCSQGTHAGVPGAQPDIKQISFNQSHELNPTQIHTGEVVYSRWEHAYGIESTLSIFKVNPDGRQFIDTGHPWSYDLDLFGEGDDAFDDGIRGHGRGSGG